MMIHRDKVKDAAAKGLSGMLLFLCLIVKLVYVGF